MMDCHKAPRQPKQTCRSRYRRRIDEGSNVQIRKSSSVLPLLFADDAMRFLSGASRAAITLPHVAIAGYG